MFVELIEEKYNELYKENESNKKEIVKLKQNLNDIKDYVNFLVIFNQTINGKFSETQWGKDILDLIEGDKE